MCYSLWYNVPTMLPAFGRQHRVAVAVVCPALRTAHSCRRAVGSCFELGTFSGSCFGSNDGRLMSQESRVSKVNGRAR